MAAKRKGTGVQHVGQRIAALRNDIDAIQDDMKGLAAGVGEVAIEQADTALTNAQSYAQARLNKALRDAEQMVDRLSDEVEEWASDNVEGARESIRNRPLAACVLSMSAGALIGSLLLRR